MYVLMTEGQILTIPGPDQRQDVLKFAIALQPTDKYPSMIGMGSSANNRLSTTLDGYNCQTNLEVNLEEVPPISTSRPKELIRLY